MPIECITSADVENVKVQFVPVGFSGDRKCHTEAFFNSYTEKNNDKRFFNSIRGFPINGICKEVPDGFRGSVLKETKPKVLENAERLFKMSGVFDDFMYWNYDKIPCSNDALHKSISWISITGAINSSLVSEYNMVSNS